MIGAKPLLPCLLATGLMAAQSGVAGAEPRIVYTRHTLAVDVHDLDLSRDGDVSILKTRIARAADEVCGGRPDRDNRYSDHERKLLLPAYETCVSDAIRRASAALHLPAPVLAGNDGARNYGAKNNDEVPRE